MAAVDNPTNAAIVNSVYNGKYPPADIQEADDAPGHFRFVYRFAVPEATGDRFFNSGVGIRGHYYRSATEGDAYTARCIAAFKPALLSAFMNKVNELRTYYESIQNLRDNNPRFPVAPGVPDCPVLTNMPDMALESWFESSTRGGKVWVITECDLSSLNGENGPVPADERRDCKWAKLSEQQKEQRLNDLWVAHGSNGANAEESIDDFLIADGNVRHKVRIIDVKTGFTSPSGALWTADSKIQRGITLHHMGFV